MVLSSYYWAEDHENKWTKYLAQEARKLQRNLKKEKKEEINRVKHTTNYKMLKLINECKTSLERQIN